MRDLPPELFRLRHGPCDAVHLRNIVLGKKVSRARRLSAFSAGGMARRRTLIFGPNCCNSRALTGLSRGSHGALTGLSRGSYNSKGKSGPSTRLDSFLEIHEEVAGLDLDFCPIFEKDASRVCRVCRVIVECVECRV